MQAYISLTREFLQLKKDGKISTTKHRFLKQQLMTLMTQKKRKNPRRVRESKQRTMQHNTSVTSVPSVALTESFVMDRFEEEDSTESKFESHDVSKTCAEESDFWNVGPRAQEARESNAHASKPPAITKGIQHLKLTSQNLRSLHKQQYLLKSKRRALNLKRNRRSGGDRRAFLFGNRW